MSQLTGNIVALTGAGISQESGLATFRDADGIWAKYALEDVATPQAYAADKKKVLGFYDARRRAANDPKVRPNGAHDALARLEAAWDGRVLVVTQNIDDLHEQAGSRNLIHMHGELFKVFCTACRAVFPWRDDVPVDQTCATCDAVGTLRPDVVWFGEMPYHMDRIYDALTECDLFISIGTSGHVYPAAGFVEAVGPHARTLEVNLEPSAGANAFAQATYGPATETVPAVVAALLDGGIGAALP